MANSPAADKHPKARLLNPWALLPVALGVALVLWLTFNSEEVFMPSGDGEPDAVSVNYAELLLQAHPENDALRLTLIDLLVKLGDFEQARHHLALLRGKDRLATPFYEVELDILGALARPEGMAPGLSAPGLRQPARWRARRTGGVVAGRAAGRLAGG